VTLERSGDGKTTQELQLEQLKLFFAIFGQVTTLGTATAVIMLAIFKDVVQGSSLDFVFVPLGFLGASVVSSLLGMVYVAVGLKPQERTIGTYFPKVVPYWLFGTIMCFAIGLVVLTQELVAAN
jgi:hypothetical protein